MHREQIHQAFDQPVLGTFNLPSNPLRRRGVTRIDSSTQTTSTSVNAFLPGPSMRTAAESIELNTFATASGVRQGPTVEIAGTAWEAHRPSLTLPSTWLEPAWIIGELPCPHWKNAYLQYDE